MLMLGGPATYSGAPKRGASNPWAFLGSMGMPGGAGWVAVGSNDPALR